jgi:signal peptide peptidase SppA
MKYERIISAVVGQPWAVTERIRVVIQDVLSARSRGDRIAESVVAEAVAAKKPKPNSNRQGDAALVSVYGVITQRADIFTEWSGGASTESIGREIDAAVADAKVRVIVLDIDSPGGGVYGVEELALKISAAAKEKKIIAVANSLAASAAYWIASAASEVVVTPNGEVGSIGVYQIHVDNSQAIAEAGQKVTIISAGEKKTAGHPYGPLDELAASELQTGVNDYYDKFVRAVARGRNVSIKAVREGFGNGGVLRAEAAVKEGMADRIATLDDVLAKYGTTIETAQRYSAENLRRRLMIANR